MSVVSRVILFIRIFICYQEHWTSGPGVEPEPGQCDQGEHYRRLQDEPDRRGTVCSTATEEWLLRSTVNFITMAIF